MKQISSSPQLRGGLRWGGVLYLKSTPHPTLSSSEERGQIWVL